MLCSGRLKVAWNGIVQGGMMEWARGKVAADISFLNYRFTFLPVLPCPRSPIFACVEGVVEEGETLIVTLITMRSNTYTYERGSDNAHAGE